MVLRRCAKGTNDPYTVQRPALESRKHSGRGGGRGHNTVPKCQPNLLSFVGPELLVVFAGPTAWPCGARAAPRGIQSINEEDLRAFALATAGGPSWGTLKNTVWGWEFLSVEHPGGFHFEQLPSPVAHTPALLGCSSRAPLLLLHPPLTRHISSSYSWEGPTITTPQQLGFIARLCYDPLPTAPPEATPTFPAEDRQHPRGPGRSAQPDAFHLPGRRASLPSPRAARGTALVAPSDSEGERRRRQRDRLLPSEAQPAALDLGQSGSDVKAGFLHYCKPDPKAALCA